MHSNVLNPITEQMAIMLSASDVALSDATAIVVKLTEARYSAREIREHMDDAIFLARARRNNARLSSLFGGLRGAR